MNLIYICVFHQENYINLLKILMTSLITRGNINKTNTDILIITSPVFQTLIQNELSCFNIDLEYYILDLQTLFEAKCAKLNIFDYENINKYDKILYLDTDTLINNDINILFDIELADKLYVLEEGYIGHEFWGGDFFNFSKYSTDQTAFTPGILYFNNIKIIQDLFNSIKTHIADFIYKNNNSIPRCQDKPFIVYNTITRKIYDNVIMKKYCVNNPDAVSSEIIIYHFPGGQCDYSNKYNKMINFNKKIELFLGIENKIAFITLTNSGYINYTLNCLQSLNNINLQIPLHCYCIGKFCYNNLSSSGFKCSLIDEEENSGLSTYKNGNWSNTVFNKFKIIHENLLKYEYVCYTDGDVVYENNDFLGYLTEKIGDYEMLIQNNCEGLHAVSTGFMFIRSTKNMISLFDPIYIENNYKLSNDYDINDYLENIKNKINYKLLPLSLFPYGDYYYKNNSFILPYLIHFNWVIGHEKKEKMIYYGKWFKKTKICHSGKGSFGNQLEGMLRLLSHSLNNKAEYQTNYKKIFNFDDNNNFDKKQLQEYFLTSLNVLSKNNNNHKENNFEYFKELYGDNRSYNSINNDDNNNTECEQNIYLYDGICFGGSLPPNFENSDEIIHSLPKLKSAFVLKNHILPKPSYDNTKINICCHIRLTDAIGRKISDNENLCDVVKYFQKDNNTNRVIIYSNDNIEHLKSENTILCNPNLDILQTLSDFIHADILVTNYSSLSISAHLLAKETQKVIYPNKASILFHSRLLNKCIKANDFIQNSTS